MEKIKHINTSIFFNESFTNIDNYLNDVDQNNIFFLVDNKVFELHKTLFQPNKNTLLIKSTEDSKSIKNVSSLIEKILKLGGNKKSYIIGIGGGIVCDITGFIASIFMRGIRFAYVPTTVLSITDAALGGKNGVNFNHIKNLVGTINEPNFVLVDLCFLDSLKENEFNDGFAEIIKHACIASPKLFKKLEKSLINYKSRDLLSEILKESISIKLNIVSKDINDKTSRKILNFGHTFGHAIEAKYKFSHGNSVSLGMIYACQISNKLGYLSDEKVNRVKNLLNKFGLPVDISKINVSEILHLIEKDKKVKYNNIDFIILRDIGCAEILNIKISDLIHA